MNPIYLVLFLLVSVRALALEPFEIKVPSEGFTNRVGREAFAKQLDEYFKLIETLLPPITPSDEAWARMERSKVLELENGIRTGRVDRKTIPKSALRYPTNQIFIDYTLRQEVRDIRKGISEIIDRSYLKETETEVASPIATNVIRIKHRPFDSEELEMLEWSGRASLLAYQIEELANKLAQYRESSEERFPSLSFSGVSVPNLVGSTGFKVLSAINEAVLEPYMRIEFLRKSDVRREAHNKGLMKESKPEAEHN